MILTYEEGLKKAANPDWFQSFYKKEDLASDEEVFQINSLVKEVGEDVLFEYFEIKEDMILQKEYVLDLIEYLQDVKNGKI